MRILILGNLGYVGTVLTRYLQANGHTVTGYDVGYFEDCTLDVPAEPRPPSHRRRAQLAAGDDIYRDVDAVIHLAALSNDTPSAKLSPGITEEINVGGLVESIRLAKAAGIERFVFAVIVQHVRPFRRRRAAG